VHRTLPAIVTDLEIRANALLESLTATPPSELSQRVQSVQRQVQMLRAEAQALRNSLGDPAEAPQQFDLHLDLSRNLLQFEQFDVPLISRWSEADRLMTEMCHALLSQVGWPFDRPLVACFSTEYYWAHPVRKIIGVPANEERRLLAVGDLGHELGHLAFVENSLQFAGPVLVEVARYVQGQLASPPAGLLDDPRVFFGDVTLAWRGWLQEFGCDAFATYLLGPAFAWQHLRLACMDDAAAMFFDPVGFGDDHPADDARMRVALIMLRELGHDAQADEIEIRWADLLQVVAAGPTSAYAAAYPDALLRAVAMRVKAHCESLGLRPYDPTAADDDVARVVNEAWEQLHADPDGYAAWESEALSQRREAWAS
jgi:hypothetical protein